MRRLPEGKRYLFQKPFGTLYPDIADILCHIRGECVYAVGDVVTYRLVRNGIRPDLSIVDGHTMRSPCGRFAGGYDRVIDVENPAGTISDALVEKIRYAIDHTPIQIFVHGEEDLAVIPLVLAAPDGVIVLYGQPGEGVVFRRVDRTAREDAQQLLDHFIELM